jgi:hypothetical protein
MEPVQGIHDGNSQDAESLIERGKPASADSVSTGLLMNGAAANVLYLNKIYMNEKSYE